MGFAPGGAVTWTGTPDLARDIEVGRGTIASGFARRTPITVYRGAGRDSVPLYGPRDRNDVDSLAFQAGDWVLTIWDYRPADTRGAAMTDARRAVWAAHLHPRQTPDGFVILDSELPLSWTRGDVPDAELRSGPNSISVVFRTCAGTELLGPRNDHGFIVTQGDTTETLCDPIVPVVVGIAGDSTFEHQTASVFQLRNLNGPVPGH